VGPTPPPLTQSHGIYWLRSLQPTPLHAPYRPGVSTIGQLVKLSREDVAAVHGVGAKSVDAIVEGLAEYGVTLAGDKVVT
jgi:hypothetical protein